jgi:hypothetical protein
VIRAALLLALVAGCGGARVSGLVGGEASVETIRTATNVTAYRLDGRLGAKADKSMHGYPVLAGPVEVDAASRATLADVLLDDDTYLWDVAKACEFMPGVLIRYEGLDVLLCFSCDELEVYVGNKQVGHEDFDPRRKDLVAVAKRLFPDDAAIGKLR